jgi:phosphoglycolate phosphatase-like HAD superfamily hydrolase
MKTKLIIFDFDGVIIDSFEFTYKGMRHFFPSLTREQYKNFFNGNVYAEMAKLPPIQESEAEQIDWWTNVYNKDRNALQVFSGMREVLKTLDPDYILCINTSSDANSVLDYLKHHDLDLFESVFGNEFSTDKIQKFNKILDKYNTSAEDALFITDTVGDILEARQVNIPSMLVDWGYQDTNEFQRISDEILGVAHEPGDILNYLK